MALIIIGILILTVLIFLRHPQFGALSSGSRLQKIRQSANFKNGQFQNFHHTPTMTEGASMLTVLNEFFFKKDKRSRPANPLPSVRTDLHSLDASEDVLVWFGHSSYFLQVNGLKFLVDPVFSGNASPIAGTTKSFPGSDVYTPDDIPDIDVLIISHDHWDHLDYPTVKKLRPKIKRIVTGLGVSPHFERWGFDPTIIEERDWNETIQLTDAIELHTAPARHFSGRALLRNRSIWSSFILITPTHRIYLGGDSGYDTHFKEIGERFGPFDLAILENGQYNKYWKYIHMLPEDLIQAANDLRAKRLLPVHWGKFTLSLHAWDEPITQLMKNSAGAAFSVVHPMIGEKVLLNSSTQQFTEWWKTID